MSYEKLAREALAAVEREYEPDNVSASYTKPLARAVLEQKETIERLSGENHRLKENWNIVAERVPDYRFLLTRFQEMVWALGFVEGHPEKVEEKNRPVSSDATRGNN